MQINITGHHVELTEALKEYVTEKIEKLTHHFSNITNVHVTLSVEDHIRQKAEAQVNMAGAQIHAEATDKNMYASIDEMVKKLDRQVIKHKEKMKDHKNGGHRE